MKKRKEFKSYFRRMRLDQKIEFVSALIISVILLFAVPVYAWFALSNRIETLTKIKDPPIIDIRAGNKDEIRNLELKDIDLASIATSGEPKRYVFCVKTGTVGARYIIQLAHTTNIPFTYTLYRAVPSDSNNYDVDYTPIDYPNQHSYYVKSGDPLNLQVLNPTAAADTTRYGRELANADTANIYYTKTYSSTDDPEIYAVPIYSQVTNIETLDADYDFFILELNWVGSESTNFNKWNNAVNNKETDMIYISAALHSQ